MNSLKALPSVVELTIHGRALTSVDSAESWLLKNSATFSASSASSAPSRRHVHTRHTDTQKHRLTDTHTPCQHHQHHRHRPHHPEDTYTPDTQTHRNTDTQTRTHLLGIIVIIRTNLLELFPQNFINGARLHFSGAKLFVYCLNFYFIFIFVYGFTLLRMIERAS